MADPGVALEVQPLPPNVAAQLAFVPAEGGAGGSFLSCAGRVPSGVTVIATRERIGIGGTVTFCYSNVGAGEVIEKIFDPDDRLMREYQFIAEDSPFGSAVDYTPLPGDPSGEYRLIAETPGGPVETTFSVGPFRAADVIVATAPRLLKPIGRSALSTPPIGETSHILAVGFEPNETLEIEFYQGCRHTGSRRDSRLNYSLKATGSVQVNQGGYAFVGLPDAIRQALAGQGSFVPFVRGTTPPAQSNTLSGLRELFNFNDPLAGFQLQAQVFAGSIDPFLLGAERSFGQIAACSAPVSVALGAPPQAAEPASSRLRFPVDLEYVERRSVELVNQDGALTMLYLDRRDVNSSAYSFQARSWNLATGVSTDSTTERQSLIRRLPSRSADRSGSYLFTADGVRYRADSDGVLYEQQPSGVERPIFTSPIGWNTWIVALNDLLGPADRYPAVGAGAGVVVIGSADRAIHSFDLNSGSRLWRRPLERGVSAPPVIVDGVAYVGTYDGELYALDARNGELRWRFVVGDWVDTPVVSGETLFVRGQNDMVFAIERESGAELWRVKVDGVLLSDPVSVGDMVYVVMETILSRDESRLEIIALGPEQALASLPAAGPATVGRPTTVALPTSAAEVVAEAGATATAAPVSTPTARSTLAPSTLPVWPTIARSPTPLVDPALLRADVTCTSLAGIPPGQPALTIDSRTFYDSPGLFRVAPLNALLFVNANIPTGSPDTALFTMPDRRPVETTRIRSTARVSEDNYDPWERQMFLVDTQGLDELYVELSGMGDVALEVACGDRNQMLDALQATLSEARTFNNVTTIAIVEQALSDLEAQP